jgi:hypothetical protein
MYKNMLINFIKITYIFVLKMKQLETRFNTVIIWEQ